MTTLTGKKIANSYKDLLQVSNSNSGIDTTLRNVEDGEGTSSPLQLSNSTINLGGTLQIGGETLTATVSALNNIADLTGATGLVAVSSGNVFGRSIAVGSPLSVTNANGTEGNPTINLANSGVSVGSYGPMSTFTVDTFGRITDVSAAATISANTFFGGTFDGSQLDIENNASIGGDLIVSGTANIATISASDVTFNTVSATTKIVSPIVSATQIHATSISAVDVFANNLSFTAVSISAQTVNQLTLVSAASLPDDASITFGDDNDLEIIHNGSHSIIRETGTGSLFVQSNEIRLTNNGSFSMLTLADGQDADFPYGIQVSGTVSATSFVGPTITSITSNIAAVSALTSVNAAAVTSINTVIDNFDFATSAELATLSATMATSIDNSNTNIAAVSVLTSVNSAAITSINAVVDGLDFATSAELATLSATMATSINNSNTNITTNTNAITSINSVIDNLDFATSAELATLSATMATSINNSNTNITTNINAITSINSVITNLSATMATSINNSNTNITTNANAITSVNAVITNLSATMATSIAAAAAGSVAFAIALG